MQVVSQVAAASRIHDIGLEPCQGPLSLIGGHTLPSAKALIPKQSGCDGPLPCDCSRHYLQMERGRRRYCSTMLLASHLLDPWAGHPFPKKPLLAWFLPCTEVCHVFPGGLVTRYILR